MVRTSPLPFALARVETASKTERAFRGKRYPVTSVSGVRGPVAGEVPEWGTQFSDKEGLRRDPQIFFTQSIVVDDRRRLRRFP